MTRDEMTKRSQAFQKETGCSEQERRAFFDGFLEAHDLLYKEMQFSLADLLAIRVIFEERMEALRNQRDYYRGKDMAKYEEKDLKYHKDPYYEKLERVDKMIIELIEKI